MKSFCVRVINVVVIVLLLCGYNVTVHAREKADENQGILVFGSLSYLGEVIRLEGRVER